MKQLNMVNEFVRSRLRRLRTEKGLKVTEIARRAGLPTSSYACLESGFYRITLDNLSRILRALEADITEVWPAEGIAGGAASSFAAARRTQVFRLNEVVGLVDAEGAALFKIQNGKCSVVLHQCLSDFLIDRLILYLEDGRDYSSGLIFKRERAEQELVLFLKAEHCQSYVRKLIHDYMSIWLEVF
jgi:transcriptional regulator with XRE-family HTH domain